MRRIQLPLPLALKIVNVYLVEGERDWTLVDSGLHTEDGERALRAGLAETGISPPDLRRVFVTHLHPDHIGMAGTLELAGAKVIMHRPEADNARRMWASDHGLVAQSSEFFRHHGLPSDVDEHMVAAWLEMERKVDPIAKIETVEDGDTVDAGGRPLRAVWTPGHTDYHAMLVDDADRVLFAGDHVLPKITSNVGLYPFSRDDPLGDFLGAQRNARDLPVSRVLPAHGEPFDDLAGRVDQVLEHHRLRLDATVDAIGPGGRHAYTIARILFPKLRSAHDERFALAETLAHLRHLERGGRVRMSADDPALWYAV